MDRIKSFIQDITDAVKAYNGDIMAILRLLKKYFPVILAIATAIAMFFNMFITPAIIGAVVAYIVSYLTAMLTVPMAILGVITPILEFFHDLLKGDFTAALKDLLDTYSELKGAIEDITEIYYSRWEGMASNFGSVGGSLVDAGKSIYDNTVGSLFGYDVTLLAEYNQNQNSNFDIAIKEYSNLSRGSKEFFDTKDKFFECLALFDVMTIKDKELYTNFNSKPWGEKIKKIKSAVNTKAVDKFLHDSLDRKVETDINKIIADYKSKAFTYNTRLATFLSKDNAGFKPIFPIQQNYKHQFPTMAYFKGFNEYLFDFKDWGYKVIVKENTPVIAPEDCIVRKIGWNDDYGYIIVLDSLDNSRRYEFLSLKGYTEILKPYQAQVKEISNNSLKVKAGEQIGYVGATGGNEIDTENGNLPALSFKVYSRSLFAKEDDYSEGAFTRLDGYLILKLLENN